MCKRHPENNKRVAHKQKNAFLEKSVPSPGIATAAGGVGRCDITHKPHKGRTKMATGTKTKPSSVGHALFHQLDKFTFVTRYPAKPATGLGKLYPFPTSPCPSCPLIERPCKRGGGGDKGATNRPAPGSRDRYEQEVCRVLMRHDHGKYGLVRDGIQAGRKRAGGSTGQHRSNRYGDDTRRDGDGTEMGRRWDGDGK